MDRTLLGRVSFVALTLGAATIACTPHGQVAGPATLSGKPVNAEAVAVSAAADARAALAKHKGVEAVASAERAVAASPRNAEYRMLLGQSYLAAGRFASAETSFRDSLTLSPDQPRAAFDLALVETAQGRGADARARLATLQGVPASDLGLALTLAGDHEGGIAKLIEAARSDSSTARARQNLALAFALNGQWREARAVAMQDTPPARLEGQLSDWASLAGPNQAQRQVALMLGVQPVSDGGLPTALALAAPEKGAPVQVALAEPTPAPEAVAPTPVAGSIPLAEPTPAAPAQQAVAEAEPVAPAAPPVPKMLAAAKPAAPALLRTAAAAAPAKPKHMDFVPNTQPISRGGYVVQLGAYARTGAIEAAWAQASRLSPMMATLSPVRGQFNMSGATLVRLSVGAFPDRDQAVRLCEKVRARGGQCFVRATFNDAPLQWVKNEAKDAKKVQLAMR
jgi:Flp pilus assembly protein TadD